ncbi:MAG TPA: 50S ribosomal protein L10 [Candidatus Paceibacterota bacterium]
MKTKVQKTKELESAQELLAKNQSVIFADFTGVGTALINKLKKELKKTNGVFKVVKKRLLKIAAEKSGLDFDPTQFDAQVGAIFLPGDVASGAGVVYKFSRELVKEKKEFKLLGAYEISKKSFLNAEQFLAIAKLPGREVLLAQLVGVLSGPIRAFMYVLQERSKKLVEAK